MEIKIPEWAQDDYIKVLRNNELIIYKEPGRESPIYEKTIRCNMCGACCMDLWGSAPHGHDDEGNCLKLRKNGDMWECTAGGMTPRRCIPDPVDVPDCVIEYKRQK